MRVDSRVVRWSCLCVLEAPAAGVSGATVSIHDRPIDRLVLPHEARSVVGETFDSLTSTERFDRGDVVAVCRDHDVVVGYTWVAFTDLWVTEARIFLAIREGEAALYDLFVFPAYRGRGIGTLTWSAAMAEAARRGRTRVISCAECDNAGSLKVQGRSGGIQVMKLYSIDVLGRCALRWTSGRRLASRFHE